MANGFSHVSSKGIVKGVVQQKEALKARPGLDTGLPCPLAALEAATGKIDRLVAAQEAARQAAKLATDAVQQALFEVRGKLNANKAAAAMLFGPYSPEFVLLGGKPRKARRKGSGVTPEAEAGPDTGAAPPASTRAESA